MIQAAQRPTVSNLAKAAAVVLLAILVFALSACSGSKEATQAVFTQEKDGIKVTLTYFAEGDDVVKQSTVNVINYAEAGLGGAADAREIFDPLIKDFEGVEGLEHKMEYGETEATETMTVDYTKADISEIAKLTGSSFSGKTEKGAKLSMEGSRQMLLKAGFTEEGAK